MSRQRFRSTSRCSWDYIFIDNLPWARRTELMTIERLNAFCESSRRTPTWIFSGHLIKEVKTTDQVAHRLRPGSRTIAGQMYLETLIPMFNAIKIISETALPCGAMRQHDPKTAKVRYVLEDERTVNDNDLFNFRRRQVDGNDYICELYSQQQQCREAVDEYERDMVAWRGDLDVSKASSPLTVSTPPAQTNDGAARDTSTSSDSSQTLEGDD